MPLLNIWVRDLSESGLRAFVADSLVPGESVTFEIPLSDTGNQVIPAKVMRALGTDYGFQFTALSAEQRNQIQAALRESPELPRCVSITSGLPVIPEFLRPIHRSRLTRS